MRWTRPTIDEVRDRILAHFKKWHPRPILIGEIATELKISLKEAEGYLEELVYEKTIRLLSKEESRKHGIVHGYVKS